MKIEDQDTLPGIFQMVQEQGDYWWQRWKAEGKTEGKAEGKAELLKVGLEPSGPCLKPRSRV